jgi:hypothetical protein
MTTSETRRVRRATVGFVLRAPSSIYRRRARPSCASQLHVQLILRITVGVATLGQFHDGRRVLDEHAEQVRSV